MRYELKSSKIFIVCSVTSAQCGWVDGVGGRGGWMGWLDVVGGQGGWTGWVDGVGGRDGWMGWVDGTPLCMAPLLDHTQ